MIIVKYFKFFIIFIVLFLTFKCSLLAKEVTIDDYVNNLQNLIDNFKIGETSFFKYEYDVVKEDDKVVIEKRVNDDESSYELLSFAYDDEEKFILYDGGELDFESEYFQDQTLALICMIETPAVMYNYVSKEVNNDLDISNFTYESNGIEFTSKKVESNSTEVTYPTYLKMSYGDKIKEFWDEVTKEKENEGEGGNDDITTTTAVEETTTIKTTLNKFDNPKTNKDGGLIITIAIFCLVSIIFIAKERLSVLNNKMN